MHHLNSNHWQMNHFLNDLMIDNKIIYFCWYCKPTFICVGEISTRFAITIASLLWIYILQRTSPCRMFVITKQLWIRLGRDSRTLVVAKVVVSKVYREIKSVRINVGFQYSFQQRLTNINISYQQTVHSFYISYDHSRYFHYPETIHSCKS